MVFLEVRRILELPPSKLSQKNIILILLSRWITVGMVTATFHLFFMVQVKIQFSPVLKIFIVYFPNDI